MALKSDGTVSAWGGNDFGQASVPAGLSDVVAIASGGYFGMAITTGSVPASVHTYPHGRIEEMERQADLIFKGRVLSTTKSTNNTLFPYWADTHATRFGLISVLKGKVQTNEVVFWHVAHPPDAWGGGSPPDDHQFEVGHAYIVFARTMDKTDYLYTPPPDAKDRPTEFRQIYLGGVTQTLDDRPVAAASLKEVHWSELNLLLNDTSPSNQLYAVRELNRYSKACGRDDEWNHSNDFKRQRVLSEIRTLIDNTNDAVAIAALACFSLGSACSNISEPYIPELIQVADKAPSISRRVTAIAAFTDQPCNAVSNALPRWLHDTNHEVRAVAVTLLPLYPGNFQEQALMAASKDESAHVRGVVADAIGATKRATLLPTLEELFATSSKPTNSNELRTYKLLWYPDYAGDLDVNDVHTSAGLALLRFNVEEVDQILKRHLSDTNFGLKFVRKLAPNGDDAYVPQLFVALKTHTAGSEQEAAKIGYHRSLSDWLSDDYGWVWDRLFDYVSRQSGKMLESHEVAPILDVLQIADDPGDARTRSLYGFFLDNGLIERAKELRRGIIRRTEDRAINKESFGFPEKLKAFDEMDRKHSLKPGLGL